MKTRLLIIIGICIIFLSSYIYVPAYLQCSEGLQWNLSCSFPDGSQNTCEQIGGMWNVNHCIVTQEIIDSNQLTCDPGPVLENETCSSNGIKLVIDSQAIYPKFANGVTEIINPKHGQLKYYTTLQVIDDEYLGNTVEEWQHAPRYELELQHETVPDHKFYENLGRLLMKNEMIYQMQILGIENANDDFEVLSGGMLTSLPPHIGYSSIIPATDGHYYWLQGGTHANQVNYYKTTQLQYPDESKFPKIKTIPNLSDNDKIPRITIIEVGGNDLKAEPYSVILSQPGAVEFYNETPEKLTVYLNEEGVQEFSFDTSQQISTRSNSGMAFPFSNAGVYSFHAKTPKNIDGKEYELNTGGAITVLADDMSGLPKEVQMEIAKEMLMSSGLPITSMGQRDADDVLFIRFDYSIEQLLPESKPYYLKAAQSLIPFDIKIALR